VAPPQTNARVRLAYAPRNGWCESVAAALRLAGMLARPPPRARTVAPSRDGSTEAIMLSHGFTVEQTVDLRIRTPAHG